MLGAHLLALVLVAIAGCARRLAVRGLGRAARRRGRRPEPDRAARDRRGASAPTTPSRATASASPSCSRAGGCRRARCWSPGGAGRPRRLLGGHAPQVDAPGRRSRSCAAGPPTRPTCPRPHREAEMVAYLQPPEGRVDHRRRPHRRRAAPAAHRRPPPARRPVDLYGAYVVVARGRAAGDWPSTGRGADGTDGCPATVEQLPPVGRTTALRNLLYAHRVGRLRRVRRLHLVAVRA